MQELLHHNLGHAKFQLLDLTVTDPIKLAENKSDKVVKFLKLFD